MKTFAQHWAETPTLAPMNSEEQAQVWFLIGMKEEKSRKSSPHPLCAMVGWQDERVKDASGFLARRLLVRILQRDRIYLGSSFAMGYGKAYRYVHPSEVIIST